MSTMDDGHRCHIWQLPIELRHNVDMPKSKSQSYWAHLDDPTGITADLDHTALR